MEWIWKCIVISFEGMMGTLFIITAMVILGLFYKAVDILIRQIKGENK